VCPCRRRARRLVATSSALVVRASTEQQP
jgi:hypothetical protein